MTPVRGSQGSRSGLSAASAGAVWRSPAVRGGWYPPLAFAAVPLEGLGRGALGGLRREEQIDRPAECQVPARIRCPSIRGRRIRCPKIRGVRCPNHVRRLLRRTAGRRSTTTCSSSLVPTTTSCGSARSWLARKDSNLRSPDPESDDPNRARGPISVLRSTSRAVCFGECQANTPERVLRTSEIARESGELISA